MTRHEQLTALFAEAIDLDDVAKQALLDGVEDESLRGELAALLDADAASGDFLEIPAVIDYRESRLEPGTLLGRYEIAEHIGDGAVGVVYRARDPDLERDVAIKVLHAGPAGPMRAPERLVKEGQAVAKLAHPNVVSIFDVGVADGVVFIAMELVDGPSIADWQESEDRSIRDAVELMLQAGRGLAAAHEAGITHGDFKPENLLLGKDGRVRVADFGLASPSSDSSAAGSVAGTPAFMAPEVFDGEPSDQHSDQFSFFASLYTVLYSEPPFRGDDIESLADAVRKNLRRPIPDRPRVARNIRRAIERGLDPDPKSRFESMDDAIGALERAIRPKRTMALGATAVVACAAVATIVAVRPGAEDSCVDDTSASAWSEARAAIKSAFESHGTPEMFTAFEASVQRYERSLAATRREACVRRRDKLDSAPLLEARDRCIAGRAVAIEKTLEAVRDSSDRGVSGGVDWIERLADPSACADTAGLAAYAVPADPSKREQFLELEEKLAHSEAMSAAGEHGLAKAVAMDVAEESADVGAPALRARALEQVGWLTDGLGAVATLREAAMLATRARDDLTAARAWRQVFRRLADDRANRRRLHELEPLLSMTDAVIERSGSVELELMWLGNKGYYYALQHDHAAALELYKKQLEIAKREFGPDSKQVGVAAGSVGDALNALGKSDEAKPFVIRGFELIERHYGKGHPTLAEALSQMGEAAQWEKQFETALEYNQRAAEIRKRTYGEESREYANSVMAVATSLQELGRNNEAIKEARRAIELMGKATGTEHMDTGIQWTMLGQILDSTGDQSGALEAYNKAIEIYRKTVGERDPQFGIVLYSAAEIHRAQKNYPKAIKDLVRALLIFKASIGRSHQYSRIVSHSLAAAHLDSGAPDRALPFAGDALKCMDCEPKVTAQMKVTLARTLVALGREPERALELATEAREVLAKDGGEDAKKVVEQIDEIWTSLR